MRFSQEEFEKVKKLLIIYEWAQRTLLTKFSIINEEFANFHESNPIGYIKGRIKTPEKIAGKLHRLNHDLTAENVKLHIKDIAGIRIICPFTKSIKQLIGVIHAMKDVHVLEEKDYVRNPKPSGYRSYHLIVEVPVFFGGKFENVIVEVQIRTEAMNFWATLERRAQKSSKNQEVPQHLYDELVICATKIAELDQHMLQIHESIVKIAHHDEEESYDITKILKKQ